MATIKLTVKYHSINVNRINNDNDDDIILIADVHHSCSSHHSM